MKTVAANAGERNNRLTLVRMIERKNGGNLWLAQCDCGGEARVTVKDFRSGHSKSCGCYKTETLRKLHTTHGMSESPEFRIWCHMMGRCYNATDGKYHRYGARGIKVCDRWLVFQNFYDDMGDRPSEDHSIDRRHNDGDYTPLNCRWATPMQQAQNKSNNVRVLLDGESIIIAEAERRLGVFYGAVTQHMRSSGKTHQQTVDYLVVRQAKRTA